MAPDQTTALEAVHLTVTQHELLRWMGLGYTFEEAALQAHAPVHIAEGWLVSDEVFADLVAQARRAQQLQWANDLEAFRKIRQNIIIQAQGDSVAAARLGLEFLGRMFPELYGTANQRAAAKGGNVVEVKAETNVPDYLPKVIEVDE